MFTGDEKSHTHRRDALRTHEPLYVVTEIRASLHFSV